MPLTEIPGRSPQHLRDVRYRSFSRSDGLWDIEGELHDRKAVDLVLQGNRRVPAGKAIHHMWIRTTVDTSLQVVAIEVAMDSHPLGHCPEAAAALQKMVGCRMGRGWRKAIQEHLGGVASCTHLRELLFNMATAAFQSVPNVFAGDDASQPPRHLGQCLGWDFGGPGVAAYYPQFVHWQPSVRTAEPGEAGDAAAKPAP